MAEQLFERWNTIKEQIRTLQKEEDTIKTRIKSVMGKINKNTLTTPSYQVKISNITRESLSKKDCPSEVWQKYCKKTTFSMLKLTTLSSQEDEPLDYSEN